MRASRKTAYVPSSYAGILRYREEIEKDKIVLKPEQVIILVIATSIIASLPWILSKFL